MATSPGDAAALASLARTQGGLVSRPQLRALGFSDRTEATRVASGLWVRRYRAVAVAAATHPDLAEAWALQLSAGPAAVVTGPVAARLGRVEVPGDVPMVITAQGHHRVIPGVRVLRRLDPGRVIERQRLRLVMPVDALIDTLSVLDRRSAHDLLDLALQRRWIDASGFSRHLRRRARLGWRITAHLRILEARAATGSRSEGEQRIGRLLRRSGTGVWVANYRVVDASGRVVAEIDFALLEWKIAVEFDGRAHHTDPAAFEHDRKRQNDLSVAGWLVLRFTWDRVVGDPQGVVDEVCRAVALRQGAA